MRADSDSNISVKRIVNTFYASNTYVLSIGKQAWLIDVGDVESIVSYLEANGLSLRGVFVTHTHIDHIYGLNDITKAYPDIQVYTTENGMRSLYSEKWNMSKYHHMPFVYQYDTVFILNDKDSVSLCEELALTVYYTPGHDWSSACYQFNRYLFTGDSYLPDYKVTANFPLSNKMEAEESIAFIKELITPSTIVCPGHGEMKKI